MGVPAVTMPGAPEIKKLMTSDPAVLNAMREGKTKKFLGAVSEKYKDYQRPCHSGVCELFEAFRPHVLVFTHLCIPIARFVLDKYPDVALCMAALYPRTPTRYTLPLFFNHPERNLPFGLTRVIHRIVVRQINHGTYKNKEPTLINSDHLCSRP